MIETEQDLVEKLTAVVPSERQMCWQQMEYYNFVHFGLNTFTGKEWGNGKVSPKKFRPKHLDTDQWVKAFKDSGSAGVILTTKHHDGFCLFPSRYTDYSVASSPYKDGKGDIVKELSDSCRKYGLKFGVYLSPWDRHEPSYGTLAYNDFFCHQLEELLTNYGDIFCVWFDGACGEGPKGKKQQYDFPRYYELIRKLQPGAVISICGPDVRWIGNEGGQCREAEWSVVSSYYCEYETVNQLSQAQDDFKFINKPLEACAMDLGSRDVLREVEKCIWYPAEMDVSITRKGWFYHKKFEKKELRSPEELCSLYLDSVGHNATLLLNVPPDKEGRLAGRFVQRLKEFGEMREALFAEPTVPTMEEAQQDGVYCYTLRFEQQDVSQIMLREDLTKSQRVERFRIYTVDGESKKLIYEGRSIGYKQICAVETVKTSCLLLEIPECRKEPWLLPAVLYKYGLVNKV